MKQLIALLLVMLVITTNTVYATGLDGLLGGLTSMFGAKNEVTYGVGEAVTIDDITITLTDVLQCGASSMYAPEDGNEFLILEFEIKNGSKEQLALSTMLSFSLQCDRQLYSVSFEALAMAMFSGKMQLDTVVESGKTNKGVVGYEVPQNWKELYIEYKTEAYFGETVAFAVER